MRGFHGLTLMYPKQLEDSDWKEEIAKIIKLAHEQE